MESVSTCTKDVYPNSLRLKLDEVPVNKIRQDINRRNVAISNLEIMG